jgi:uncharacterized protein
MVPITSATVKTMHESDIAEYCPLGLVQATSPGNYRKKMTNNNDRVPTPPATMQTDEQVIAATVTWLKKAVIGLGLCPFAASVHLRDQIRYRVSTQTSIVGLVEDLVEELQQLHSADPQRCETSLLIHPYVLHDFLDYNDFLNTVDDVLQSLGYEGELQVASFHPQYQFSGSEPDDIENYTNRSPYPMLHLLREASVSHAVATFPGVDEIAEKNQATLRRLGKTGWQQL